MSKYTYRGSYLQFKTNRNLALWLGGTIATSYAAIRDDAWSHHAREDKRNKNFNKTISDIGIAFNTPLIPALFYYISRKTQNQKMWKFSQEYLAALGLVLVESHVLSMVPIHKRPAPENMNFFDKNFRYESSFPSGHVVGFLVLGLKLNQFYGSIYAFPCFVAGAIISYERVQSGKHYVSDVVGSWILSLMAAEGVKLAANSDNETKSKSWIVRHDFSVKYIANNNKYGLTGSITF